MWAWIVLLGIIGYVLNLAAVARRTPGASLAAHSREDERGAEHVKTEMKIVVVGAGIGGLTTALQLHRAGVECEVYEQGRADPGGWASG